MTSPSWKTWRAALIALAVVAAAVFVTRYLVRKAEIRVVEKSLAATPEGRAWWEQAGDFVSQNPSQRGLWIGRIGRLVVEKEPGGDRLIALEIPAPKLLAGGVNTASLYISLRETNLRWTPPPAIGEVWCVTGTMGDTSLTPSAMRRYR